MLCNREATVMIRERRLVDTLEAIYGTKIVKGEIDTAVDRKQVSEHLLAVLGFVAGASRHVRCFSEQNLL